jgi:5-methylcytosine-specific restriction protein A
MPRLPARPCLYPGCAALVDGGGYCVAHRRRTREYDQYRGSPTQRGYGVRHERWRRMVLRRCPVCAMCHAELSKVADHIIALTSGGTWALSNGQGLCTACHNRKIAAERCGHVTPPPTATRGMGVEKSNVMCLPDRHALSTRLSAQDKL